MKNRLNGNGLGALLLTLLLTGSAALESPVADAAQKGDLDSVRTLLRGGADVNAAQGDGMTALHWAAMNGGAEMAGVLLYAGANPESTTRLGHYTPLHLASKNGHATVVSELLQHGAHPETVTSTGATSLHLAAAAGSADAVAMLIDAGVEVDVREGAHDQTPLHWATAANRLEAMRALIASGAEVQAITTVIDYAEVASLDGPDRQRRERLVVAAREAEKAAEDARAARLGTTTVAEESAAQLQSQDDVTQAAQQQRVEARQAAQRTNASVQPDQQSVADRSAAALQSRDQTRQQDDDPDNRTARQADDTQQQGSLGSDRVPGGGATTGAGGTGAGTAALAGSGNSGDERPLGYTDLVGVEGGLTPLHYAARDGHYEAAMLLLEAGADVNQPSGDNTTPLLMATINGNYDLAMEFLARGADPNVESEDGAAPLFATLNNRWAPKSFYPQPTAFKNQRTDYLEMMEALLKAGADVDHRTERHIWYTSFNFDILGVNLTGATAFWRAAYATDVPAMKLLVAWGADPNIPTAKAPSRRRRGGGGSDPSGLPDVPTGGPSVYAIHAASGVGYGTSRAGNSHRHVPDGWLPAVKYLVEELGADVNARDEDGFSPVHHAAARGDNEMIKYLVSKGADVSFVSRRGQTTVDMANGPQQRVQPFPETIALLEGLGATNNHNCLGC